MDLGTRTETGISHPAEAVLAVLPLFPRIRGLTCLWAQTVKYIITLCK